jgi:hypothetical protein
MGIHAANSEPICRWFDHSFNVHKAWQDKCRGASVQVIEFGGLMRIDPPENVREVVVVCSDLDTGKTYYFSDYGRQRLSTANQLPGNTIRRGSMTTRTEHRCYLRYYSLDDTVSFPQHLSRHEFYAVIGPHILTRIAVTGTLDPEDFTRQFFQ